MADDEFEQEREIAKLERQLAYLEQKVAMQNRFCSKKEVHYRRDESGSLVEQEKFRNYT